MAPNFLLLRSQRPHKSSSRRKNAFLASIKPSKTSPRREFSSSARLHDENNADVINLSREALFSEAASCLFAFLQFKFDPKSHRCCGCGKKLDIRLACFFTETSTLLLVRHEQNFPFPWFPPSKSFFFALSLHLGPTAPRIN
jgi:hypothetical protein